jgi:hypothetical protein
MMAWEWTKELFREPRVGSAERPIFNHWCGHPSAEYAAYKDGRTVCHPCYTAHQQAHPNAPHAAK